MKYERRYALTDRDHHVSLAHYYSSTWDVLAGEGEEEDYHIVVVATFTSHKDAEQYIAGEHDAYVIGMRPPSNIVAPVVEWIHLLAHGYIDGVATK